MKIKIINPNTTWSMTEKIRASARQVASATTEIIAVSPSMEPVSIESHYDEAMCVPGLLEEICPGEACGVDGYVIACLGNPGLYAAREIARGPVIGIAEAAMHVASFIGVSLSVVTTLSRTCGMAWHLAERYGMQRFCRNVRACDLKVLDLERTDSNAFHVITEECRRALIQDKADCIVLGCVGMSDLCQEISREIDAPVIDGVGAAVKIIESIVQLGLLTSKRGEWAYPPSKGYTRMLYGFSR